MKKIKHLFIVFMVVVFASTGFGSITANAYDDDVRPTKVRIKSSYRIMQGKYFKLRAKMYPRYADDDDVRWEIISGKKYVRFADDDRSDDSMEFKAVRPGKAKVRCYVRGKNKKKYGDIVTVTVKKRKPSYTLSRVGRSTKVIEVGDDFDLQVKKGHSLSDRQLKWKISNSSIVRFDSRRRTGNDIEFQAIRPGTTKITCYTSNSKAKTKKVTYTIKVVRDNYDDDYYDDYYDDDYDYDYDDYDHDYDDYYDD